METANAHTMTGSYRDTRGYTVHAFAQRIGTSPSNVQNMLIGYKGQKLIPGWVGYQIVKGGRWAITKASIQGEKYVVPEHVLDIAIRYVMGDRHLKTVQEKSVVCILCSRPVFAKELCTAHYQQQRRAKKAS